MLSKIALLILSALSLKKGTLEHRGSQGDPKIKMWRINGQLSSGKHFILELPRHQNPDVQPQLHIGNNQDWSQIDISVTYPSKIQRDITIISPDGTFFINPQTQSGVLGNSPLTGLRIQGYSSSKSTLMQKKDEY